MEHSHRRRKFVFHHEWEQLADMAVGTSHRALRLLGVITSKNLSRFLPLHFKILAHRPRTNPRLTQQRELAVETIS